MNKHSHSRLLIALDLDGTAVRYEPRLEMDPGLIDYLRSVRSRRVGWVMNSDRFTGTMIDIACLLQPDERPAAILSCQRFIHLLDGGDVYRPAAAWNSRQEQLHRNLWDMIAPHFSTWAREIEKRFTIVDSAINDLVFAYMAPSSETPQLREHMRRLVRPWPAAQISGNQEWTFVLHADFSKGRVLAQCAEMLGIDRQNIIAVGDGINDISMVDGSVTPLVGCPANASPEVAAAVAAAGGIIAQRESAAGTLQVLQHYLPDLIARPAQSAPGP